MRHDSIAFEIQKSTWIRQKQLDRNIKELRYDRNKEYLYGEFKHYLVVKEHYDGGVKQCSKVVASLKKIP